MVRPAATGAVSYTYAYTADATGSAVQQAAFTNASYKMAKWSWDNLGTFASVPVFTAYKSTSHDSATRNDGFILGGSADTTNSVAFSYLKGNIYGQVDDGSGAPTVAPTNAPLVTSGVAGSVNPTAGANWQTNYQSLNGDTDYCSFAAQPAATTAGLLSIMFALFTGPGMSPSTYTPVLTLKYTYT